MNTFIIQDWACNTLQKDGLFNFGAHGENKGVPMIFESFEDGWDWIYTNVNDEDAYQDLYVEVQS